MRFGPAQEQGCALHRFPTRRLEQGGPVQQFARTASQSDPQIQLAQQHQAAIVVGVLINPPLELRFELRYEDHHVARTPAQKRGQW
jgi:hypothetical protein